MASVLGIDVGNATSVVGLARRNGIDVVLNSESKRETPSLVNFAAKQRFIGVAAGEKISMEPKNTIGQLKRLLGKRNGDPELAADAPSFSFAVHDGPDGVPEVKVQYLGEQRCFRAEQLLAGLLGELKQIGEKDHGAKVADCVLSVPGFFTEQQRRAVLDAAAIAGLNVLRLVHETTATALAYGIYKTDLPETKPVHVAFVDAGHASLQVAVVAFTKAGLKVLGYGYDRNFGGRNFDEALFNHLADECKTKYKIDVRANARASLRMRIQCEKSKKVLSSNPETPFAIECLMNDVDVKAHLTRDAFEAMCGPLLGRALQPARAALADAGLAPDQISAVEIVGGASRLPALCRQLESFFGKPLRRTMNAAESVARGCALQGAMLSPTFHVTKRFEVEDASPYPVSFSWRQSEDGPDEVRTSSVVFPKGNPIPSLKALTFFRSGTFPLTAEVAQPELLPPGADPEVGRYEVGPIPAPRAGGKAKLKLKVRLNLHGCVQIDSATAIEELEPEPAAAAGAEAAGGAAPPAAAAADAKMDDAEGCASAAADGAAAAAAAAAAPPPAAASAAPMDTDGAAAPAKKKVLKCDVPFVCHTPGLAPAALTALTEKEFEMALQDKVMEETKERKNALEAYVLGMRSRLASDDPAGLAAFASPAQRADFGAALAAAEDWLYGDGEDETKGVYSAKFAELRAAGDPTEERWREAAARAPAAAALKAAAEGLAAAASGAGLAHCEPPVLDSLRREAEHALAWLADKGAQQAALAAWDPPAFAAKDCDRKREALDRFAKPILATPKPAPPPAAEAGPKAADLD